MTVLENLGNLEDIRPRYLNAISALKSIASKN
jgi:hypothetical protein